MSQRIPIYIPTYINNQQFSPARVQPRLFFYNGLVSCETWWMEDGYSAGRYNNSFPYFDNYNVVSGSFPTSNSNSLLFNNENAVYGEIPTDSLYTSYWEKYISLLYDPRTRLLDCSAIIPLADYFHMSLNDIVEFRGNYYHLRAINDYNLQNGECTLQLLGPIIPDSIGTALFPCSFDFSVTSYVPTTTTTTTTAAPTTTTTSTTTTAAPTTTTTSGPITTTTTIAPPGNQYTYYQLFAQSCCAPDYSTSTIEGTIAVSSSISQLVTGNVVGLVNYTGSLGFSCFQVSGSTTNTGSGVIAVIDRWGAYTGSKGYEYYAGDCTACNRDFIPVIVGNNCKYYYFSNPYVPPVYATSSYVSCGGTPVTASFQAGGTLGFCSQTRPTFITGSSSALGARLAVSCSSCGTF